MKHPKIKFRLNKKLDQIILSEFFSHTEKAGFNFKKEIILIHPELKLVDHSNSLSKVLLNKYVDNFYQENLPVLKRTSTKFQSVWDTIEPEFFNLSDKIFKNLDWPKGKYIGYISILPVGARFIESKTFQSCWLWEKNLKAQVIHELLHFQFYNLAEQILGQNHSLDDEIWKLSEIFNDIVQREDEFVSLQGYAPKISYPDHEDEFTTYLQIWQEHPETELFIRTTLKK